MLRAMRMTSSKWMSLCLLAMALASCGGGGGGSSAESGGASSDGEGGSVTACSSAASPAGLPVIRLLAASEPLCAEVAGTAEQRESGLMFRQSLGANEGMLFVFSNPTDIWLWMRNTGIPLSAAFIDENGVILNIEDMQPMTDERHYSRSAAKYALEMNQGWFARKNIQPGSRVSGLP